MKYQCILTSLETGYHTVAWIDEEGAKVGKTMTLDAGKNDDRLKGRFRVDTVWTPGRSDEWVKMSADQARNTRKVSDI